jgi:glycosyltransferase involved in cell wall biosynthesis
MNEFKISIITVVRNDKNNIRATINSVLNQTYLNIEYIVIDGASTDGTLEIIREYGNKIFKIISEPDKCLYDAMNKGTVIATGDWISYLNSGDIYADCYTVENIFFHNKKYIYDKDVIYSDVIADFNPNKVIRKAKSIKLFFLGIPFSHQANFVKIKLAKKKLFNLEYAISADYDFLYSIYKDNAKFYYFDFPFVIVDVTNGISKNVNLKLLYTDFLKISIKYSSCFQIVILFLLMPTIYLYASLLRLLKKTNLVLLKIKS